MSIIIIMWALFFLVFFQDFGNLKHSSLARPLESKKRSQTDKKKLVFNFRETKKEDCFCYQRYVMSITK